MSAPRPCPPWCDRQHAPAWPVHGADLGEVEVGGVTIAVDLARYADDQAPVVNLTLHDAEETRVQPLTREQAAEVRNALDAAVNILAIEAGS